MTRPLATLSSKPTSQVEAQEGSSRVPLDEAKATPLPYPKADANETANEKEEHQPFWRRKDSEEDNKDDFSKTANIATGKEILSLSNGSAMHNHFLKAVGKQALINDVAKLNQEAMDAYNGIQPFPSTQYASDIQPLPSRQPSAGSVPGAHAVVGRPFLARPRFHTNAIRSATDDPAPVNRAIVVDVSNTSLVSPGDHRNPLDISATTPDLEIQDNNNGTMEVFDATILPDRTTPSPSSRRTLNPWVFGGVLLAVVACASALLTFILVVVLPQDSDYSTEGLHGTSKANSSSISAVIYPPYSEEFVLPQWLKEMAIADTPAYKANIWMREDPNLWSYSSERQAQRFMNVYFYYFCGGDTWLQRDHWLSYNVSECLWFNKSPEPVCNDKGEIVNFNLTANNLTGTLTSGYAQFIPSLVKFDVSNNDLYGKVPAAVSSSKLEELVISNNHFEGHLIGDGAFAAFRLRVIKLDGNQVVGSRGSAIYQFLPDLEVLNVTSNHFHGEFNDMLKHCPNMTYIGFGHNDIYGGIPSEMGLLPKLQEIDVAGNPRIKGMIPSELGALSHLSRLDVTGTSMVGKIPEVLCSRVEDGLLEIVANCSQIGCCAR